MTTRERNDYMTTTLDIIRNQAEFSTVASQWASLPNPTVDITWLSHLHEWQATLEAELSALPPKIRNEEDLDKRRILNWSLGLIARGLGSAPFTMPIVDLSPTRIGQLMAAAGYETQGEALRGPRGWLGSLSEVSLRIQQQSAERQKVQMALDRLLVSPAEHAQMDAESQSYHAALLTMDIKNSADGRGLVAFTLDGDPLPVEKMDEAQRDAFERFTRASFPQQETADV
jgi:hypothetical protein